MAKKKASAAELGLVSDFAAIKQAYDANSILYLDIETTGLKPDYAVMTSVTVFDGSDTRVFVRDENLDELVPFLLSKPELFICTFNGAKFDIPFIEAETGQKIPHQHVDLLVLGKESLGLAGGFKAQLKHFGVAGLDSENTGLDSIWLWNEYQQSQDRKFRDALVAYNTSDAMALHSLLAIYYNTWAERQGLGEALDVPIHMQVESLDLLQEVAKRRKAFVAKLESDCPYIVFTDPQRRERAALIKDDDIHDFQSSDTAISASITGSQGDTWELLVAREGDTTRVRCSCPDFAKNEGKGTAEQRFCKHVIKLLEHAGYDIVKEMFPENANVKFVFSL